MCFGDLIGQAKLFTILYFSNFSVISVTTDQWSDGINVP